MIMVFEKKKNKNISFIYNHKIISYIRNLSSYLVSKTAQISSRKSVIFPDFKQKIMYFPRKIAEITPYIMEIIIITLYNDVLWKELTLNNVRHHGPHHGPATPL